MTSERGQGGVGVGSQAPPRQVDPRQAPPRQVDPRQVDPRQVDFVPVGLRSSSCPSLPQGESPKGDIYFRPRHEGNIEGQCKVFEAAAEDAVAASAQPERVASRAVTSKTKLATAQRNQPDSGRP